MTIRKCKVNMHIPSLFFFSSSFAPSQEGETKEAERKRLHSQDRLLYLFFPFLSPFFLLAL